MGGRFGTAVGVSCATLALVGAGAAGASGPAPSALYASLAVSPFANAELPSGFSRAQIVPATVTSSARTKLRVVGALQVVVAGPDPDDDILYAVYGTQAAARYAFDHPVSANSGFHVRSMGRVAGVSGPSKLFVGTGTNVEGTKVGVSIAGALAGDVVVSVLTDARAKARGDTAGTGALLRSGLKHLASVLATSA